jgi:hypothetical protein
MNWTLKFLSMLLFVGMFFISRSSSSSLRFEGGLNTNFYDCVEMQGFKKLITSIPYSSTEYDYAAYMRNAVFKHFRESNEKINSWGKLARIFIDYCKENDVLFYDANRMEAFRFLSHFWKDGAKHIRDEMAAEMEHLLDMSSPNGHHGMFFMLRMLDVKSKNEYYSKYFHISIPEDQSP